MREYECAKCHSFYPLTKMNINFLSNRVDKYCIECTLYGTPVSPGITSGECNTFEGTIGKCADKEDVATIGHPESTHQYIGDMAGIATTEGEPNCSFGELKSDSLIQDRIASLEQRIEDAWIAAKMYLNNKDAHGLWDTGVDIYALDRAIKELKELEK